MYIFLATNSTQKTRRWRIRDRNSALSGMSWRNEIHPTSIYAYVGVCKPREVMSRIYDGTNANIGVYRSLSHASTFRSFTGGTTWRVYLPPGNCRWRFFHLEIQSTSMPFARHGYKFSRELKRPHDGWSRMIAPARGNVIAAFEGGRKNNYQTYKEMPKLFYD